jgi:hypothetical protein
MTSPQLASRDDDNIANRIRDLTTTLCPSMIASLVERPPACYAPGGRGVASNFGEASVTTGAAKGPFEKPTMT